MNTMQEIVRIIGKANILSHQGSALDQPPADKLQAGMLIFKEFTQRAFQVIFSNAFGWDHVSCCMIMDRNEEHVYETPDWDDMCYVKRAFFRPDEMAVQYHPAEGDYINFHPHVLNLWRPHKQEIPMPPAPLV